MQKLGAPLIVMGLGGLGYQIFRRIADGIWDAGSLRDALLMFGVPVYGSEPDFLRAALDVSLGIWLVGTGVALMSAGWLRAWSEARKSRRMISAAADAAAKKSKLHRWNRLDFRGA